MADKVLILGGSYFVGRKFVRNHRRIVGVGRCLYNTTGKK